MPASFAEAKYRLKSVSLQEFGDKNRLSRKGGLPPFRSALSTLTTFHQSRFTFCGGLYVLRLFTE
jgi:hypothetical protein